MKIYTVILSKPGRTATCQIRYREANWPDEVTWAGDLTDFRLQDGSPMSLHVSMDRIKETVAHQARQAGAAVQMRNDGGDVKIGMDELKAAGKKVTTKSFSISPRILRGLLPVTFVHCSAPAGTKFRRMYRGVAIYLAQLSNACTRPLIRCRAEIEK